MGEKDPAGKSLIRKTCSLTKLRLQVSLLDFALKVMRVPFGPDKYDYEKSSKATFRRAAK